MKLETTYVQDSDLPWRVKSDAGLESAARTQSGALAMFARMVAGREKRDAAQEAGASGD